MLFSIKYSRRRLSLKHCSFIPVSWTKYREQSKNKTCPTRERTSILSRRCYRSGVSFQAAESRRNVCPKQVPGLIIALLRVLIGASSNRLCPHLHRFGPYLCRDLLDLSLPQFMRLRWRNMEHLSVPITACAFILSTKVQVIFFGGRRIVFGS